MAVKLQSLGLDIGAKVFDANFSVIDSELKIKIKGSRSKTANTSSGHQEFIKWIEKKYNPDYPLKIVMEATGVYHEELAYFLHHKGYQVHILLPNRVKGYMQACNAKTKNDKVDAKYIAQMGLTHPMEPWEPASDQMYLLKRLSRERAMIIDEKTAVKNQLHAEKSSRNKEQLILARFESRITFLEEQRLQIEEQMRQEVQKDEELARKVEQLCSIKGVGFITVICVIAETNGFALIKNGRQLTSYAGYDVVEKQSGSSVKGKNKISKKGNAHLRKAMYFPAISVCKYLPEFTNLRDRIFDKTHIKMKGYVAAQRKLLLLMYTLYKNDQPYDPDRYQQTKEQCEPKTKSRQPQEAAYTG